MEQVAVCSWSLQPTDPRDLAEKVRRCGIGAVQLALDPLCSGGWNEGETVGALRDAGVEIVSGMMGTIGEDYSTLETIRATGGVRLDANWDANREAARAVAGLAQRMGLALVTFHAGFLPHDAGEGGKRGDPVRAIMLDRLCAIGEIFAAHAVGLALETGQEDAATLVTVLDELAERGCHVGVNFDPANMILYGMGDPVAALAMLAPRVRQIHVKDAKPCTVAGTWGEEVVVGTGSVAWREFFAMVQERCPVARLVIEREAGTQRVLDVIAARRLIEAIGPGAVQQQEHRRG
jgi:sugar phosphate isomerase/epimerase